MKPQLLQAFAWSVCALALVTSPSQAAFHLWQIVEVYSSSDGTVQFIELLSGGPSENQDGGAEIRTDSGKVFPLTGDITGNTSGDRLLFATEGFYALPGAPVMSATQPLYELPEDFFDPMNDRIRLFSPLFQEFHFRTINATNPIPTDNVFSRVYSGATTNIAANTPQARDTTAGSINRGDYNSDGTIDAGDYVFWRKTFNLSATPPGNGADGNTNGTIDDADYTLWTQRFGNEIAGNDPGSGGIVPEPATLAFALVAWSVSMPRRRRNQRCLHCDCAH
jgi:hypothetical protein